MSGGDNGADQARRRERAERMRRILGASELGGTGARGHDGLDENAKEAPFVRPEGEDDDGYDPYSDRPAPREGLERDPWR